MKDFEDKLLSIIFILVLIAICIIIIMQFKLYIENEEIYNYANTEETTVNITNENIIKKDEKDELAIEKYVASDGNTYDIIALLEIPELEIKYPVISSTSKKLLKVSLNKYFGPNPNRKGNFCIVGHNYTDDRFFGKLDQIENGYLIQLTDVKGESLNYYVYDIYISDPSDTSCTKQSSNDEIDLTLITCANSGKKRLIVKARAE